jgi:hypothetical protein
MGTNVPRGGAPGLGLPLRDASSTSSLVSILRDLLTVSGLVPTPQPASLRPSEKRFGSFPSGGQDRNIKKKKLKTYFEWIESVFTSHGPYL